MSVAENYSLSIVVPVYNSVETLGDLVSELSETLGSRPAPYEIILVNDGSADGSWDTICALAKENTQVRGVNLMRNFGQHNALLAGVKRANHEVIVTLDDDLQNPPSEIPRLLEELAKGFDVVYGRPQEEQHGFLRNVASVLTKRAMCRFMGAEAASSISAYRVFRTKLREAFGHVRLAKVSIDVLLTWGTSRFGAIRVAHHPRKQGKSNYSLRMLVRHTLNMTVGFSSLPLRVSSIMGFLFMFMGMGVLAYVLTRWLIQGSVVQGFPFLASTIAIFSGVQLFALGVIGEYIGYIHSRSLERPTYLVREETDVEETPS